MGSAVIASTSLPLLFAAIISPALEDVHATPQAKHNFEAVYREQNVKGLPECLAVTDSGAALCHQRSKTKQEFMALRWEACSLLIIPAHQTAISSSNNV